MIKYENSIKRISLEEVKDRLKEGAEIKSYCIAILVKSIKEAKECIELCEKCVQERLVLTLFEELSGKESELFIKKNDFSDTPEGKTLRWAEDVEIGKGVRTNRKIRTEKGVIEPWKKGMVLLTTEDAVKAVYEECDTHPWLEGAEIIEKHNVGVINVYIVKKEGKLFAFGFAKMYPIVFHENIYVEHE